MAQANLKRLFASEGLKVGHAIFEFDTPGIGQIVAAANLDFVFLDMEHSGFGIAEVKRAITALRAATLPVLVTMVSGHYPMLSAHPQTWLIVAFIIVGGACLRHALVSHEVGEPFSGYAWTLPVVLVALFAAIWLTSPQERDTSGLDVSDVEVMAIVQKHCVACHAANPKNEGFDAPPKDVVLENIDQLRRHSKQVVQFSVQTRAMPLGNETGMTDQERSQLGAWINEQ